MLYIKCTHMLKAFFTSALFHFLSLSLSNALFLAIPSKKAHTKRKKNTRTAQPPTRLRLAYMPKMKNKIKTFTKLHRFMHAAAITTSLALQSNEIFFPLFWIFFFFFGLVLLLVVTFTLWIFRFISMRKILLCWMESCVLNRMELCVWVFLPLLIYTRNVSLNSDKGHSIIDCWWWYYREAAPVPASAVYVMAKILS